MNGYDDRRCTPGQRSISRPLENVKPRCLSDDDFINHAGPSEEVSSAITLTAPTTWGGPPGCLVLLSALSRSRPLTSERRSMPTRPRFRDGSHAWSLHEMDWLIFTVYVWRPLSLIRLRRRVSCFGKGRLFDHLGIFVCDR